MDNRIKKWLVDIETAGIEIRFFTGGEVLDFEKYKNNLLLKRAIERNLEIIGEAVNRIIRRDTSFENKISHAHQIVGFRNHIIHGYDSISDETVYSILLTHLNPLLQNVDKLLNEDMGKT